MEAEISIYVRVSDAAVLIAKARAKYTEEVLGGASEEVEDAIPDLSAALRYLLDPGLIDDAGFEVLDSSCELSA